MSTSRRWAVAVVSLVLLLPVIAAGDGGRSMKTVPLNRKALEPGTTWWCQVGEHGGRCMRTRERCEDLGLRCIEQKTAYAYSSRLRSTFGSHEVFDTDLAVFDSKEHCDSSRRLNSKPENTDPEKVPHTIGLSTCSAVGAKAPPPLKPLPAGKGYWCFAYAIKDKPFSACGRSKHNCQRAQKAIESGMVGRAVGQQVSATSSCEWQKKAWAWIATDDSARSYSDVYADKDSCEVARMGTGEACQEVK